MSTDWSDKKEVLKAVSENGIQLKNASDKIYASDEMKADKDIFMAVFPEILKSRR